MCKMSSSEVEFSQEISKFLTEKSLDLANQRQRFQITNLGFLCAQI
jgi:hypothetical protein